MPVVRASRCVCVCVCVSPSFFNVVAYTFQYDRLHNEQYEKQRRMEELLDLDCEVDWKTGRKLFQPEVGELGTLVAQHASLCDPFFRRSAPCFPKPLQYSHRRPLVREAAQVCLLTVPLPISSAFIPLSHSLTRGGDLRAALSEDLEKSEEAARRVV